MTAVAKKRFKKILALVLILFLGGVLLRMIMVLNYRSNLAVERRDDAKAELNRINNLSASLEREARSLESVDGQRRALRDRYGLVSENEGYLILLHDHPHNSENKEVDKWWQR
jgi:hypothetical protein